MHRGINNANIGLDSYIDWNGDPGRFVSEFMGHHESGIKILTNSEAIDA